MSSICPILRCTLLSALALAGATFVAPASAQQPSAQPVPWRHGVLEAKSDAGFIFMPAKGGFAEKQGLKLDVVQFKGDAIALKAMMAGGLDTYEGSPCGPLAAGAARGGIKNLRCHRPTLTYWHYAHDGI